MRMNSGTPLAIDSNGAAIVLQRTTYEDRSFTEDFIQDIIERFPHVLPVSELSEEHAPLIPIGREIPLPSGSVDNLYISPSGNITVVEAKLWRNPQSRREVVGQIIDYAKDLASWSYEDLDSMCRQVTGKALWTLASTGGAGSGVEAAFVDSVAKNLRNGRFLLLIVGDGIREEVERMVAYVQGAPNLQFHLALVELRIYENVDNLQVIVPSLVARTAEIDRAVVKVDVAPEAKVTIAVSVPSDNSPRAQQKLSQDELVTQFPTGYRDTVQHLFQACETAGIVVYVGAKGCSLRVPVPNASQPLSIAWLFPPGVSGWMGLTDLTLGFDIRGAAERLGEPLPTALTEFLGRAAALSGAEPVNGVGMNIYRVPPATFNDDVEEVVTILSDVRRALSGDE